MSSPASHYRKRSIISNVHLPKWKNLQPTSSKKSRKHTSLSLRLM